MARILCDWNPMSTLDTCCESVFCVLCLFGSCSVGVVYSFHHTSNSNQYFEFQSVETSACFDAISSKTQKMYRNFTFLFFMFLCENQLLKTSFPGCVRSECGFSAFFSPYITLSCSWFILKAMRLLSGIASLHCFRCIWKAAKNCWSRKVSTLLPKCEENLCEILFTLRRQCREFATPFCFASDNIRHPALLFPSGMSFLTTNEVMTFRGSLQSAQQVRQSMKEWASYPYWWHFVASVNIISFMVCLFWLPNNVNKAANVCASVAVRFMLKMMDLDDVTVEQCSRVTSSRWSFIFQVKVWPQVCVLRFAFPKDQDLDRLARKQYVYGQGGRGLEASVRCTRSRRPCR